MEQTCTSNLYRTLHPSPYLVQWIYFSIFAISPDPLYFGNFPQIGALAWASLGLVSEWQVRMPQVEECVPGMQTEFNQTKL